MSTSTEHSQNQAIWRSRRGLLELDLLFVPFSKHGYETLTEEEKRLYQELLLIDDVVLLDWLRDPAVSDTRFRRLIKQVKRFTGCDS